MLALDGLDASPLANLFSFIAHLRHQVSQKTHIGFVARGGRIDFRAQHVCRWGRARTNSFVAVSHGRKNEKRTVYGIPRRRSRAMQPRRDTVFRCPTRCSVEAEFGCESRWRRRGLNLGASFHPL